MNARVIAWLLFVWLVGCSSGNTDSTDTSGANATDTEIPEGTSGDGTTATGSCASESRAEEFVPGMAKETESGFEVELAESDPAPPARQDNSWVIAVKDANGEPILDAQLTLNPRMPDHGHGAPREAVVTQLGDGRYRAEPVALFMPGYWTIDVSVSVGDDPPESVQFGFCVP